MAKNHARRAYGRCRIEGCSRDAVYPNTRLCSACYQSLHYHLKRGVRHVMEWSGRLSLWQRRCVEVQGRVGARRKVA